MFQFFWRGRNTPFMGSREVWCDDILRHPAIAGMDERQRGDLPMPRPTPCEGEDCHRNGACLGGRAGTSM